MKLNMQFLDHYRKQFLDLHDELIKIDYSPQAEAALTNFKTLMLLEIALLSVNDFDWSPPAVPDDGVLGAAVPSDDADDSSSDQGQSEPAAPAPAAVADLPRPRQVRPRPRFGQSAKVGWRNSSARKVWHSC
jgi:hypothetical protein